MALLGSCEPLAELLQNSLERLVLYGSRGVKNSVTNAGVGPFNMIRIMAHRVEHKFPTYVLFVRQGWAAYLTKCIEIQIEKTQAKMHLLQVQLHF